MSRATVGILSLAATGAAAPAWTPADIDGTTGLRWYDFTDTATISHTAGAIDQINDKFTSAKHLTGSGATRPTTGSATLNSLNVGQFAADYLTAGAAADWTFLHDGTAHVISAVVKFGTGSNPSTFYGMFGTNGTSSSSRGASAYYNDDAPANDSFVHQVTYASVTNFNVNHSTATTRCPANTWMIMTILSDPDNGTAANRSTIYPLRGRNINANTASNAVSGSTATHAFQLGAAGNNVGALTGEIAEFIISSDWSDRYLIENYYSDKFGLQQPFAVQDFADQVTITA